MRLQRLVAILTVLLRKDVVSAPSLAEKFEVSVRTIYRDIQALEEAGIPIVTHTGIHGGVSIIDEYKIDKKLFTNEDIAMLLTGLNSMSSMGTDSRLNMTLEKIRSLIPQEHNQSIVLKSNQLFIDMTPWSSNPMHARIMESIKLAMVDSKCMMIRYGGRSGDEDKRTVEPHQLILKEKSWYLRGYCQKRQDFRVFKISRITEIEILDNDFIPKEFDNALEDFKEWKHDQMITVNLLLDAGLKERILEHCKEEYIQDLGNGQLEVALPFVESEMGYSVLLGMGHQCEVLSPSYVKEELKRRIVLLNQVYQI